MKNEMSIIKIDDHDLNGHRFYDRFKRAMDFLLALLGIALLSWLYLLIAIFIKCGDWGPVFYSQARIGKNGQPFKMWKFRSMVTNADELKADLMDQNEVEGNMFKMKRDPRITRVGAFIRKYSLDELPQLWNVVRGDMSLIGPRPALPEEVSNYTEYDRQRLLVIPGCTGYWQVTTRNSASFAEMINLDLTYIKKRSIWFDIWIMFMTIKVMIVPNSAY